MKMCFGNALKYGLFSTPKVDAFLSYLKFKTSFFTFFEGDFSTLKPLNQ